MDGERSRVIAQLEDFVIQIEMMQAEMDNLREGRRPVAMVLTKLDEARLWLGEAILVEK